MMLKYHFSSYWGTWSRVLSDTDPRGPIVEVNLTPLGYSQGNWDAEVRPVRIRFHCTPSGDRDIHTDELPDNVHRMMIAALGEELVERLLTEDFLLQVDYKLYSKHCNGGANLDDIRVA